MFTIQVSRDRVLFDMIQVHSEDHLEMAGHSVVKVGNFLCSLFQSPGTQNS